jgi:hypothetical protein
MNETPPPLSPGQAARNLREWDELVKTSLSRVTETAKGWVTAFATYVAVITAAFVIKGPESFAKLPDPLGWVVVAGIALHVGLMLTGMWLAQSAATPPPSVTTFEAFNAANVAPFQVQSDAAIAALRRLALAKVLVVIALGILLITMVVWATAKAPAAATLLSVTRDGEPPVCGEVLASEDGLRLLASGAEPGGSGETVVVDLSNVVSATVVEECP